MNSNSLLIDGLEDTVRFVGGSLLAFWLGRLLGFNIFDAGYSNSTILGIVLVGLGGGLGLQIAHRVRTKQRTSQAKDAEQDN